MKPTDLEPRVWIAIAAGGLLMSLVLDVVGLVMWALVAGIAIGMARRTLTSWMWLVNPLTLVPLAGGLVAVLAWCSGSAELLGYGLVHGRGNLDPTCRCYFSSLGCMPMPVRSLYVVGNDAVIEGMTQEFGIMPFAYRGPYPTAQEAYATLTASSQDARLQDLANADPELPARYRLSECLRTEIAPAGVPTATKVKLADYHSACVLIGTDLEPRAGAIVVVVPERQEIIARYHGGDWTEQPSW